jgi:hypothetical protein
MTAGSYQLASRKTYWFFVMDLPVGDDGKRRQRRRSTPRWNACW